MKKIYLFSLLILSFVCVNAQTDLTEEYLANPAFNDANMKSNAPNGWILELTTTGVQSKISTAEKAGGLIPAGQNHWQLWQPSGALTGKAYQTSSGLPIGRYKLTADISASFGGTIELFINNKTVAVVNNDPKTYEVEALISNGELELGLNLNGENGGTIDVDNYKLYQLELDSNDAGQVLELLHEQCVDDTLAKDRQKWYNYDEMKAALEAYDNMRDDESKIQEIVSLLQNAHQHYMEITDNYKSLRAEAIDLYNLSSKSKFVYLNDIKTIRLNIILYYLKDEDNYEWVCESLKSIREYASLYVWYQKLAKAESLAMAQVRYTNYEGRDDLRSTLSNAYKVRISATTEKEFKDAIEMVEEAKANYLANRPSEWITIQNGKIWKTNAGATVQAHAPGFVRVGDIWYMVGEDRTNSWNPDVNLYSSTDLVNWRFEKKIIQNGVTTKELGSSRMIERPKLLYNKKTDKFVVWCHYESGNYGASEAACFECDSVNGAYNYIWSGRPMNVKSRDCNVFQDTDGTAYFISTTEENQHLGLFKLDDEYHEAVVHTQLFSWQSREAPAIVKINNRYFMFNSACSGWDPNQCKMSFTNNLTSGWSGLSNVGNPIAYDTQAAAILEIKGTKQTTYLYVGDRWQDPNLPETKTIIFPISFNGTTCNFKYHERFDINFVTGEWRETPVDDYFADKSKWTVAGYSSQENTGDAATKNVFDGNVNTKWHTKYSGTVAEAPHYVIIDMGETNTIKGFLATPRMDSSTNGLIRKYQFQVSEDGENWKTVSSGDWLPYCTEVLFTKCQCRYIKLICMEGTYASVAEIDVVLDTTVPTAVEAISGNENIEIVSRTFYSIDGKVIDEPQNGMFIEKALYSDGSIKTVKKYRR